MKVGDHVISTRELPGEDASGLRFPVPEKSRGLIVLVTPYWLTPGNQVGHVLDIRWRDGRTTSEILVANLRKLSPLELLAECA